MAALEEKYKETKRSLTELRFARNHSLTEMGCSSLKLTADSAGKTISLLPVKAAPAVPAPAPAAAPMAAPLPPPASAPINAPAPAPPPMNPALLLPLPFKELVTAVVWTF